MYVIVEARDAPDYRKACHRVSRIALAAVVIIAATGIVQTLVALPTAASVLTTTYGRLAIAKTGGLLILVLFGYRNQFRLLPALEDEGGANRLRGSVLWETLVMAVVFILAAMLAYVPPTH